MNRIASTSANIHLFFVGMIDGKYNLFNFYNSCQLRILREKYVFWINTLKYEAYHRRQMHKMIAIAINVTPPSTGMLFDTDAMLASHWTVQKSIYILFLFRFKRHETFFFHLNPSKFHKYC